MESLAFELGIDYRQLGRVERGEINTTIYTIYKIANSLQVSENEIYKVTF